MRSKEKRCQHLADCSSNSPSRLMLSVKRPGLVKYFKDNGFRLLREGANHAMTDDDRLTAFTKEINDESDRGVVLIMAARFDDLLNEILLAYFVDVPTSKFMVSGFNAPLGTFAARTNMAYSLALITENEFKELNLIRKVRNEFGHSWGGLDFNTEKVRGLCLELPYRGPAGEEKRVSLRSRFVLSSMVLFVNLVWRPYHVQKIKCSVREHWDAEPKSKG